MSERYCHHVYNMTVSVHSRSNASEAQPKLKQSSVKMVDCVYYYLFNVHNVYGGGGYLPTGGRFVISALAGSYPFSRIDH